MSAKFGCLHIEVKGFNQLRLLGELAVKGVKILELNKISASQMKFWLHKKDSAKAFAILEKLCYNYNVTERYDLIYWLRSAAARAGLVAGVLIFSAVLALSYAFIWRIDIKGCENVDSLTIKRLLNSQGIYEGKPLNGIDKNHIRNLVNGLDGIIETSVEISGTTLVVEVVEETQFVRPDTPIQSDILSMYDAEVTKIITTSGTTLVKSGSRVFKGSTLVAAYKITIDSQNGEKIFNPTPAQAKVYGKVTFSKTVQFSLTEYTKIRTGKKFICTDYSIFGLNIKGSSNHGFEFFESETQQINTFEGLFFPLKMTRTTFYETVENQTVFTLDDKKLAYKNQFVDEVIINAGSETIEYAEALREQDGLYILTMYLTAELLIGEG